MAAANRLWLDETLKARKSRYVPALHIAVRYAELKNPEQTLACLEKAFAEGEQTLAQIKFVAQHDFVRDDERIQRLVQKILTRIK